MVLVKDFSKDFTNLRATRGRGMGEVSSYSVPSGSKAGSTREARRAEFDGVGWMGWDGVSKVSFNVLHN